jgi:hypothetical protein
MSSLHVILPVQYLRRADAQLAGPQKRLMLAVLQTVLDDCQGTAYARATGAFSRDDQRALQQAIAYFESHDRSWPYSFDNICDAIGLDAEGFRRSLRARLTAVSPDGEATA